MTRRVLKIIFFNRDANNLCFRLIWNRTRACCTPSCRYTRCRRCCSWSGSRDEVSQLYQRGVNHVASHVSILQIWTDLYHLSHNQSKTGIRMLLTSSVKELEAILQKLIKSEPGLILVHKNDYKHWLKLMAMRINFLRSRGLGAPTETETKMFSQELEKWEKKADLNSV